MPPLDTLLFGGLIGALPWWRYLIIGAIFTHLLVLSTTLYLHRGVTHRSLLVHPWLGIFFRAMFWLAQTSTVKEWVSVHRKHHRFVDTAEDPHSPQHQSLWKMLFATAYRKEARNPDTIRRYGSGTPEDWLERNLFTKHRRMGILVLAKVFVVLFGFVPGAIFWVVQVIYLPVVASFGVNGIGHSKKKKSLETGEYSWNVLPFDFLACGEFYHHNHHADPNSAKLSRKWYQFDSGWGWVLLFGWISAFVRWISRSKEFELIKVLRPPLPTYA